MNRWVVKTMGQYLTARRGWSPDIGRAAKYASEADANEGGQEATFIFEVVEVTPMGSTWAEVEAP